MQESTDTAKSIQWNNRTKTWCGYQLIQEEHNLRLGSVQYPLAWKLPVQHIILLLHGLPLIYPLPLGGNIAPWIFKLLSMALGLSHNFLHNVLIKKLFKYIYSISKALNTVMRSINSSKSFSLSNAIVHVLPHRKLSLMQYHLHHVYYQWPETNA